MIPADERRALASDITATRVALNHGHRDIALQTSRRCVRCIGFLSGRFGRSPELDTLEAEVDRLAKEVERALLPGEPADHRVLTAEIADAIRVLRDRDGIPLTDEQIAERGRNITGGLLGAYDVRTRP